MSEELWRRQEGSERDELRIFALEIRPQLLKDTRLLLKWRLDAAVRLGDLLDHARAKNGGRALNLPWAGLRSLLELYLPDLMALEPDAGLSSARLRGKGEQNGHGVPRLIGQVADPGPPGDATLLLAVRQAIASWISAALHPFCAQRGLGELSAEIESLNRKMGLVELGRDELVLLDERMDGEGLRLSALAQYVAGRLGGAELFPGLGPCRRLIEPRRDSSAVTLISKPLIKELSRGGHAAYSMVATLSLETMPYRPGLFLRVAVGRRRWMGRALPRRGLRRIGGFFFPRSESSRAFRFELRRGKEGWAADPALTEMYAKDTALDLPRTPEDIVKVRPKDGKAWAGIVYSTMFGAHPIGSGVSEQDEADLFESVQRELVDLVGAPLSGRTVDKPKRFTRPTRPRITLRLEEQILSAARALGVNHTLDDEESLAEVAERVFGYTAESLGKELNRGRVEETHIETLRKLNAEAISALHPGQVPHLWLLAKDVAGQDRLMQAAKAIFGDSVIMKRGSLPDAVHGLLEDLPGKELPASQRCKARVEAWRATAEEIARQSPVAYVIVEAAKVYRDRDEDQVNMPAALRALTTYARANVHYVLPPDEKGLEAYLYRVQLAATDLLLAHNGFIAGVAESVDAVFAADRAPREIIGLVPIRRNPGIFSGATRSSAAIAIRFNVDTGLSDIRIAHRTGAGTAGMRFTPWMTLREGLRFVSGAERLTMGDGRDEVGQLFREFSRTVVTESAASDRKPLVLVDGSTTRGLWEWLNNRQLSSRNATAGALHTHLERDWKDVRLIRVRSGSAPPVRRLKSADYVAPPPAAQPAATRHGGYHTTGRALVCMSAEAEGCGRHYFSVGPYQSTSQSKRGVSTYREIQLPEKAKENGASTYRFKLWRPWTDAMLTPNALEVTVALAAPDDDPDKIAHLVAGLRSGYAQTPGWTTLPAPLFFELKVRDYFVLYQLEVADEDEGGREPSEPPEDDPPPGESPGQEGDSQSQADPPPSDRGPGSPNVSAQYPDAASRSEGLETDKERTGMHSIPEAASASSTDVPAKGTLAPPSFVTREWVDKNIGNVQNSDIRVMFDTCRNLFPSWPEHRPSRDEFVTCVYDVLKEPFSLLPLARSMYKSAGKKRALFKPFFKRMHDIIIAAGEDEAFKASFSSGKSGAGTIFTANLLYRRGEFEDLAQLLFLEMNHRRVKYEDLPWIEDTPKLEGIAAYARALSNWEKGSVDEHVRPCANGADHGGTHHDGQELRTPTEDPPLQPMQEIEANWERTLAGLRGTIDGAGARPDRVVAEAIRQAAERLVAVAIEHEECESSGIAEIANVFDRTIVAARSNGRNADLVEAGALERLKEEALRLKLPQTVRATVFKGLAAIEAQAPEWTKALSFYEEAQNAFNAAHYAQKLVHLGPMQEKLAAMEKIKARIDETLSGLETALGASRAVPIGGAPPADHLESPQAVSKSHVRTELPPAVAASEPVTAVASLALLRQKAPVSEPVEPPNRVTVLPDVVTQALAAIDAISLKGRHALASFVANALTETYPSAVTRFHPELYRLAAIAAALREIADVPPEAIGESCEAVLSQSPDLSWNAGPDDRAGLLYLFAGTLYSSLFIPASAARSVVEQALVGRFGTAVPLHRLTEHLGEADRLGVALAPEMLSNADPKISWQRRLMDLQNTAREWKTNSELYNGFGNYRPAETAWSAMVDANRGVVGKTMRAFADRGPAALDLLRSTIKSLQHDSIEALGEQSGVQRSPSRQIEGRARSHINHNLEASRAFFERCVRHLERATDRSRKAAGAGVDRFATMLRERATHARQFLAQYKPETPGEAAAVAAARAAAEHLTALFDGQEPGKADMPLDRWFGRELLLVPGLRFSAGWEPDPAEPQAIFEGAIRFAANGPEDLVSALDAAFQEHRRSESHVPTGRILVELSLLGMSKGDVDLRQTNREADIRELRKEIGDLQNETRDQINMAMALNLINDVEKRALEARARAILVEKLPWLELKPDDIPPDERGLGRIATDFPTAREILKGVQQQLDTRFEAERDRLKKEVDVLSEKGLATPESVGRILQLIDARDIVTVNEYLRLLKDGQELPSEPHRNAALRRFMRDFLPKLEREFSTNRQRITETALGILEHKALSIPGLLDAEEMSAMQRADAARMLTAWRDIRTAVGSITSAIETFFAGGLSFDVKQVEPQNDRSGRVQRFHLSTTRLIVPDAFVVPHFGSEADGNYAVEVIRGSTKTIELFQRMQGDTAKQRATFHLFAGLLGASDRTELVERAHNLSYQSMVIDDALVVFLAFLHGNRLAAFFRVATAFIKNNPYNEVTPLPLEMFYGRRDQREQIVARRGGSLIFGGRRLGKSSLLRDVERKEHNPKIGFFVRCVDIHDIGQTEGYADRLWQRLANELRGAGIAIRRGAPTPDDIVADIRAFLDEKTTRRLLLMLDEADAFLAAEEENRYENLVKLRQLLEATQGRFKVVMAGLHNVQRTATKPNQSLGHLGTPVCIGPFVGDDRREGIRLVTDPMATLGFEFESPTLPLRILSQTNYYPALVQLYCHELLDQLYKTNKQDQDGPPYKITAMDLDAAYRSQALSAEINKRFRLTLDLDDRYKLITLVIANAATEQSQIGTVPSPMKPEQVARECVKWSPLLFENRTPSAFLALLEELVGLGVLAQQGHDGFVLRSPNIVTMMGSAETISEELLHFENREPLRPDRSAQRRILEEQGGVPSPLTPAQEHRLLQGEGSAVSIVLASPATGLASVERAIRSVADRMFDRVVERSRIRNIEDIVRLTGSSIRSDGTESTLILVPSDVGWTLPWVRRLEAVARDLDKRRARVIFIAGPLQARILSTDQNLNDEVALEPVELWTESTLRNYLAARERKDLDVPELREQILVNAGGTGDGARRLVHSLREKGGRFADALSAAYRELAKPKGLVAAFGVDRDIEAFFRTIALWSPCSENDIADVIASECREPVPLPISSLLKYGAWMGVLQRDADLRYVINPLLQKAFAGAV